MPGRFVMISSREQEVLAHNERQALLGFTGLTEHELRWVRLEHEPFPALKLDEWDGIILCGSRFDSSAPEESKSDWQLAVEAGLRELYGRVLEADFPFLGLCYGMGTLNTYLGGVVDSTYAEEISAPELTLTDEGQRDPLLTGVAPKFRAYVGHHEAITELAPGLVTLVSGKQAPIQMIRAGKNVYATQFHPELDQAAIELRIDIFSDAGYYPLEERARIEAGVRGVNTRSAHRVLRNFAQLHQESRHLR